MNLLVVVAPNGFVDDIHIRRGRAVGPCDTTWSFDDIIPVQDQSPSMQLIIHPPRSQNCFI